MEAELHLVCRSKPHVVRKLKRGHDLPLSVLPRVLSPALPEGLLSAANGLDVAAQPKGIGKPFLFPATRNCTDLATRLDRTGLDAGDATPPYSPGPR